MTAKNLDPELAPILEVVLANMPALSVEALPAIRRQSLEMLMAMSPPLPHSVITDDRRVPGPPGAPDITIRIYRPAGTSDGLLPCLYWIHGGGMMVGTIAMDDGRLAAYVEELGCVAVSVEYRLAPEHPHPAPVEDCHAGLRWTAEHAGELGIDLTRLVVGGASAGGGLAAATVLRARDQGGPAVSYQFLLSPMLDDRAITASSTAYGDDVLWSRTQNTTGWAALLGDRAGTDDVSPYAAPARATVLTGLPAAFVEVGEVETFRDECIDYARRLAAAGVSTELHVYPGAFHGFDVFAPESALARQANENRTRALRRTLGIKDRAL